MRHQCHSVPAVEGLPRNGQRVLHPHALRLHVLEARRKLSRWFRRLEHEGKLLLARVADEVRGPCPLHGATGGRRGLEQASQ